MVRLNARRAQRDLDSFRDHIEDDPAAKGGAPPQVSPSPEQVDTAALASLNSNQS